MLKVTRYFRPIEAALCVLAALPALAKEPDPPPEYPPGLFENSPVIGDQPVAPAPDQRDVDPALQDDCADIATRIFRSRAEVRAAHARCDGPPHSGPSD